MAQMTFLLSCKTPLSVVFAVADIITFTDQGEREYGNVTRLSKTEWVLVDYKSPFQETTGLRLVRRKGGCCIMKQYVLVTC